MAQSKGEIEIGSSEEFEEQLTELTTQIAREVVKRKNGNCFEGDYGEFYQMVGESFYQDAPLSVIDYCEYSPSIPISEIAASSNSEKDFTKMLARDILSVAVRDGVLSMVDGEVIGKENIKQEDDGTWRINGAGRSGFHPPDGWREVNKNHPDDGIMAFTHSYFQCENGYELVIWEEIEESQPYMSGEEDEAIPCYAIELYDQDGKFVQGSGFGSVRWAKSAAKLCMQTLNEQ